MNLLGPREAYRLWAPTYEAGNAITCLDEALVARLGPAPTGKRLLDVGCGTGWRLRGTGAARMVGVDLSPDMLELGRANASLADVELLEADMRALPLPDRAFDLVWCRLAIGYVAELDQAYAELARVADSGASVIVTEFHPQAVAAGCRRTLSRGDEVFELATYVHREEAQLEAARRAGLRLRARDEGIIGPSVRPYYEEAGREALYREVRGMPVVLGLAFTRDG
jgi:malonyl-CoA O-methyltransferase